MTGFVFSSCKKENKVAEDSPPISNFEEFQARAGDRLVYSEEHSDDEFDCYLYYAGGEGVEPILIAQAKKNYNKGIKPPIICDQELFCLGGGNVGCYLTGNECSYHGSAGTTYCDFQKLMTCFTE